MTPEHLRIVRIATVAVVIAAMGAGLLGTIYLWRAEWAPDSKGRRHLQPTRPFYRVSIPLPDPNRLNPAGRPLYRRGMWLLASAVAGFGIALIPMALYARAHRDMTRQLRALVLAAGVLACGGSARDAVDSVATHPVTATPHAPVISATAPAGPSVLREEITVRVGTTPEHWALLWRRPPAPACGPNDDESQHCPCIGFAYGEMGELDLARRAPGRPEERLALTPLFKEGENPAAEVGKELAVLQRWPVLESDYDAIGSVGIGPKVRARPVARAMTLGDYDHDGRATEFLLQVGTAPCGHTESVLVGVSTANPSLHAFASVAHPERPLVLEPHVWKLLLGSGKRGTGIEIQCGDHGAETQTEVSVHAGSAGIDGTRSVYQCTSADKRGPLLRSERI